MKFKDFQAPVLFSSTFKALNLGEKNSSTFKDFQGCMGTLSIENVFHRNYSPIQTYVIKEKHAVLKLRTYYLQKCKTIPYILAYKPTIFH